MSGGDHKMYGDELTGRKKAILKAVVESYIENGDPVGSKSLQLLPGMKCSSATIRNEMAELESMGYLEQPHTSSGRVPSQLGYRFYVDQLIERYAMTTGEVARVAQELKSKTSEVDQILLTASRLASALTNYTGIAAKPKCAAVTVSRFETAYIDACSFVLIMISSTGSVTSKHIRLNSPVLPETIARLSAALNENVAGLAAAEINLPVMMRLEEQMGDDAALVSPIVKTIYETMTELDGGELRLSGINHLLQYPDYSDPDELGDLLGTLEQKEEILELVSKQADEDISVVIGSESPVRVMNNSSLVFKPIKRGDKTIGVIGVLGPLRMDYARVLETIEMLCGMIGEMIDPAAPQTHALHAGGAGKAAGSTPSDSANAAQSSDDGESHGNA